MEKVIGWIRNCFLSIPGRVCGKRPGWIFSGLIFRLVLSPFFLHTDFGFTGDIVAMNQNAHLMVFNPDSQLRLLTLYPPLAYYTMVFFQVLFAPLAPPVPLQIFGSQAAMNWFAGAGVFRQLFLFKLWYLIFDLGAAYLLWRLFQDDQRNARLVFAFWFFNPIIIYDGYLHGQFDVVPIFFIILALYFAKSERLAWSAFFIGIAACYKNYPFLFLLPAVLILTQVWWERVKLVLLGTVPYTLLFLPHFMDYRTSISGYGDWFFRVGYDVGFGGQVYIFIVLYAVLLWYLHYRQAHTYEELWRSCLAILLVYYQFSYFDLHYWAWIIPFAAIYWVERPSEAKPFYLIIGLCLLVLIAPVPIARFLAPISPRFFLHLPSLMEMLNPYLPMLFITNVARSLLAGTCFYLAWRLLRSMPTARRQTSLPAPGLDETA